MSLFQGDISKTFVPFCYLPPSTFHISGLCGICLRRCPDVLVPWQHQNPPPPTIFQTSLTARKCTFVPPSVSYALVGKCFTGVAARCCVVAIVSVQNSSQSTILNSHLQSTEMQRRRERVVQHRNKVCICTAPLDSSTAQCLLLLCVV